MQIGETKLDMELDTGSSKSTISESMYRLHFPQYELTDCGFFLNCYNGFRVPTVGTIHVPVTYRGETTTLPLVVVRGSRPCLLGRDWLFKLKLDWKHIFERHALHQLSEETELDTSI